MILKYIYMALDGYPDTLETSFGFRTRYLCNFVERQIKPLRFKTEGFSRICVWGVPAPSKACPIVPDNALVSQVAFDQAAYGGLEPTNQHEFFIAMLRAGLMKCARHHSIPSSELMKAIEDFRAGGYRNEWVHGTKLFREQQVRVALRCSLDSERFVLRIRVERKGERTIDRKLLTTLPDEIIFGYRFKDIVMEGNKVVVRDKFGDPAFTVKL